MFTRNFLNLMSSVPQASTVVYGTMPVKDVYGMQYCLSTQHNRFPNAVTEAFTSDAYAAGISFGSDDTTPTENDYNLHSTITSGISVSIAQRVMAYSDGPSYTYHMTVTNTSSDEITIGEIGYKQMCRCCFTYANTSALDAIILLDRTVFDPVITLQAGQTCSIRYRLATNPWEGSDNGVKVVSWQFGSDSDVAAMIDAAHMGTIDLKDHWAIGDMRRVSIDAFTSGDGVQHAAQTIDLTITSFDNYNNCGCVMQADFSEGLATAVRMNESTSNSGGYGSSEMRNVTLPALANAMPSWLKSKMMTFTVKSSEGNLSSFIDDVTGNKLALRSEVEAINRTTYSHAGEGTYVRWYLSNAKMRQKRTGRNGGNAVWWLRSPQKNNATDFVAMRADGSDGTNARANTNQLIAPFMCL